MSVLSEIDRIKANVASTYNALEEAGAEMPQTQNTDNMPSTAASIKLKMVVKTITFASDLGNGTSADRAILSGDDFVKEHYAKNGFAVLLYPISPVALLEQYVVHNILHGNANVGSSDTPRYGFSYMSNSATALGYSGMTEKISGTGYNACFRAGSNGNLNLYVGSNRILKAGTYMIVMICWED